MPRVPRGVSARVSEVGGGGHADWDFGRRVNDGKLDHSTRDGRKPNTSAAPDSVVTVPASSRSRRAALAPAPTGPVPPARTAVALHEPPASRQATLSARVSAPQTLSARVSAPQTLSARVSAPQTLLTNGFGVRASGLGASAGGSRGSYVSSLQEHLVTMGRVCVTA